ncbi:MAG: COX15/CtaA family protein, partial [Candidatus Rokubacteria bacterium]|nr:COX15/CtaA family protein [Candidatus Rokubacteria bacterium]
SIAPAKPALELRPAPGVPRGLAWVAVVLVFLLMVIGNVVSATGSGLACPDWPLCHGRLIPPLEPDIMVEWSHRLVAALSSIVLLVTIGLVLRRSAARGLRRLGVVLLVLLGVQILLGGVTVLLKLPDLISTAHLVNGLLIFAGLVVLAAATAPTAPRPGPEAARLRHLIAAGLAALLVQLALGGYVRHAGAGLACPDFPLCGGDLVPSHGLGWAHWVHRWLGVALLGLFLHLAMTARRAGGAIAGAARLAAALAVVQVTLGILAVLLRLTPPIRAAHAAAGYALWGVLVWLSARAGLWTSLLAVPRPAPDPLPEALRA